MTEPSPAAPQASSVLELDDIVVPPRPPLPATSPVAPASSAAPVESSSTDHVVEDAPAAIDSTPAADPTPADVAVEEPAVEDASVAADPTPADVAVEEPVVEEPAVEESAVEDASVAADPTPVDVAVEEPAVEDAPVAADPTPVDVAVEEPAVEEPAVEEPAVEKPAVEEPAVEPIDADENPEAVQATDPEEPSTDAEAVTTTPVDPTPPDVRVDELDSDVAPDERTIEPAVDTEAEAPDTDAEPTPATATAVLAQPAVEVEAVASVSPDTDDETAVPALALRHVTKNFGELRAVDAIDLTVPAGSFYGLVGPNGAGKTTTLSIIAGLLRADAGTVTINGVDAKKRAREAKKLIGVLPDRLRTFDRLTGRQLLSYYGALRGLPSGLVESRMADLARAFDLVDALARPVSDYSAGMTKKVMLAGAMIHSPRLLVLDEPFEAVDPVSSGVILDILGAYVDHGGTVILSSHGMELVERVCSRVAVIVSGQVLAEGTVDEVRGEGTLEQRFRELSGGLGDVEGLEWLHTFSA
ncbi:ABC transporter ATP-binding protein [Microbacterium sp. HMWF026]|uniref:ABC transporter ATP-binding protein n=1 Tax=Microbacterium sp. HMWF026 TaxID=2056861 RepID=UPI00215A072E|nr:ATP-binding cassette domain-containing protein [Microbacterium sp. HMWF026]